MTPEEKRAAEEAAKKKAREEAEKRMERIRALSSPDVQLGFNEHKKKKKKNSKKDEPK